jgi:HD-like signal output (HDOD) protein
MMLPVVLFIGILAMAVLGCLIYWRSVSLADDLHAAKKEKNRPKSIPDWALLPSNRDEKEPVAGSVASRDIRLSEVTIQLNLSNGFLPEDEGVYHRIGNITERGWNDLDYTLMSLSRLPASTTALLYVLNDPDSSASDVARICENNVGLTARILKIVNSPYYGLRSKIESVQQAVTLVGYDEIRQVILTSSLFGNIGKVPDGIEIEALWRHSLAVSRITLWLAGITGRQFSHSLAGTCGMLHDVGKLVLQCWRPEGFRKAMRASELKGTTLMTEELNHLGLTHPLAGAFLLSRWNLPVSLVRIVKGAGIPEISEEFPEQAIVYAAGAVARSLEIGHDGEWMDDRIPIGVMGLLGIGCSTITELMSEGLKETVKSSLEDILPLREKVKS